MKKTSVGVKNPLEYANKLRQKEEGGINNPWLTADKERFTDPEGILDPRLDYRKSIQSTLILRMAKRGEMLPPNTRLDYVYLANGIADSVPEDYTFFHEYMSRYRFRLQYEEYITRQFQNPIIELFNVVYPTEIKPAFSPIQDVRFQLAHSGNEVVASRLRNESDKLLVDKVLENFKSDDPLSLSTKTDRRVLDAALRAKSQMILKRIYKRYGVSAPPSFRPRNSTRLKEGTSVILHKHRACRACKL
jgi:hypothetical protein